MMVGKLLLAEKSLKINKMAELLDVDRRTLSNWKNIVKKSQSEEKLGRPSYNQNLKFKALIQVGREWKKQGCPGWRPVSAALKEVPTRLVQLQMKRLKLLSRVKERKRVSANRKRVTVKYKNIIWAQDGAQFKKKKYQIIKDRGSKKIITASEQKDTSQGVVDELEAAKENRGLPLVLCTDNGSNYVSKEVGDYLTKNKIVHLRSLPRTPQHNGSVECAIREIKEAASENRECMSVAAERINKNRLRASFLFKTSNEMDEKMTNGYHELQREKFYEECMRALEKAQADTENKRSMRMNERKVILNKLVQFELVKIN